MGWQPDREPKGNPPKIVYLCDREKECNKHGACGQCCKHTTDIRHAVNFIDSGDGIHFEERPKTPTIDAEQWHVIKKRPMTNDERIEWSEEIGHDIEDEDAFIYFNLPDDGEEVLVSTQFGLVYVDTFCQDEGCYFEENGDMDGIVAWMEKPKPYRGDKE